MYVCIYLFICICAIIVTDCSEEEGVAVQLDERESWKGRQEKGVWATGLHRVQKGQQISMKHNKKIIERRRTVRCMYITHLQKISHVLYNVEVIMKDIYAIIVNLWLLKVFPAYTNT